MNKFIKQALISGLQKLYVLRLENAPSADTLREVGKIWIDAIAPHRDWNAQDDQACIDKAFADIICNMRRFPTPADFFHYLPPREAAPRLPTQYATLTEVEKTEVDELFNETMRQLKMPSSREPTEITLKKEDGTCTTLDGH